MCTYCSLVNGLMLSAIRFAWKGEPWGDVEILNGKSMQPTPGKKKRSYSANVFIRLTKTTRAFMR